MTEEAAAAADLGVIVEALADGNIRRENVALRDLVFDDRFNRLVSESQVSQMVADFQPRYFGTLTLASSPAGLVVVDGQARVSAVRALGVPEDRSVLPARIIEGLDLPLMARLFLGANNARRVSPLDRFHARLAAKDQRALDVERCVKTVALSIGPKGDNETNIEPVTALEAVWAMTDEDGVYGGALIASLRALFATWGIDACQSAPLIRGMARFLVDHPRQNADSVAARLKSRSVIAGEVLLKEAAIRRRKGTGVPRAKTVAEAIASALRG